MTPSVGSGRQSASSFARALTAGEPSIPTDAQLFAPFIGDWDLTVRWFDEDGTVSRTEAGEWLFAWVLEGRAVQDVWIVPPRGRRDGSSAYEYGTSIRFYDPGMNAWQSTWVGPMQRVVRTFTARETGDAIVLETEAGIEPALRWSFRDIAANSFTWRNEVRDAAGWRLQQTFAAKRRTA